MKLADLIDVFIPGDWGEAEASANTPNNVYCIRGADIVPVSSNRFENIPQRHVSNRTFREKLLREGDLVVEKSGGSPTQSTGRIAYISSDLIKAKKHIVCSNFCIALRLKPSWNPLYVYYYWMNIYNHGVFFNFEGKTTGIKNLQLENALSNIDIEDVSLEEQARIVSILSSLDDTIRLNRQINDNLPTLDRSLKAVEARHAA